jgi:hypothetical protein
LFRLEPLESRRLLALNVLKAAEPLSGVEVGNFSVADFNGDGKPDIAAGCYVPNFGQTYVQVLLGTGSGTFTDSGFDAPGYYVTAAKVNGDSFPDLIIDGDRSVHVFLGNGQGAFAEATGSPFSTGSQGSPSAIAVSDVNGDNHADVLVANWDSSDVSVLLGNGAGGFAAAVGSPFSSGGQNPDSLAVGDLNEDGKPDIAATNSSADSLGLLLGNGSGGFTPAPGSPLTTGDYPRSVRIADVNEDGHKDLVDAASNDVEIWIGNGTGGFAVANPVTMDYPGDIVVADIDGDGHDDLAADSDGAVKVLLGDGTGGFSPQPGSPFAAPLLGIVSVAAGDFNGDGKPDLVAGRSAYYTTPEGRGFGYFWGGGVVTLLNVAGPQITSTPNISAVEDTPYSYNITTQNPGGSVPMIKPVYAYQYNRQYPDWPSWLTLTDHGDGTATLSGTPTAGSLFWENTVVIQATDGVTAHLQQFNITVAAVNDPPTISAPASQATDANVPLVFSNSNGNLIGIADEDAGIGNVQLALAATNGTITLPVVTGLTFVSGANGQANLTIRGTLDAINNALDGLSFQTTLQYAGSASLKLTANDLGNTGSGGPKTAEKTIPITVNSPTVIVDNSDPGYLETAGTWSSGSLHGYNNSTTRYSNSANASAKWTPVLQPGFYTIAIYKLASNASASAAKLSIVHDGATQDLTVDLRATTAGFQAVLGTYYFRGTGDEIVRLTQGSTVATLRADAIRFTKVPTPVITVDNSDPAYAEPAGAWAASALQGYNNTDSRYSSSANAVATWKKVLTSGFYTISIFKLASNSSSSAAKLSVIHDGITETFTVDLRATKAGFVQLAGTYFFRGTGDESVQLAQGSSVGILRADAIRFTKTSAPITIVDNSDSGYVESAGAWSNSSLKGYQDTATRYSSSANATARWTPVLTPGFYSIAVFKVASSSSSSDAKFSVVHDGLTDVRIFDLRTSQARFVELSGSFYFRGTGNEFVQLTQGSSLGILRADAIRFTKIPTPVALLDNGLAGYAETGAWSASGLTGYNGSSTRYSAAATATATWTPAFSAGYYRVEFYKVANATNQKAATIRVSHNGQNDDQLIDLSAGSSGFVTLGAFYFNGSGSEFIRLSQSTAGTLRADAVRFTKIPSP